LKKAYPCNYQAWKKSKKIVLSGNRPTGKLHLGNYFGALKKWIEIQDSYKCFFFIADYHALTTDYENTKKLKENILEVTLDWLSFGISPKKSTIFIQSLVPEHCELHLILSMIVPLSWLERNPTYKEQIKEIKNKNIYTYGFFGYPVLQTADILIYKADYVPVGEDQLPHLELTREIARRFNHLYGKIFIEPNPILSSVPKLLGIDNRKMSKTYENCIYLSYEKEVIRKKVMKMITDPQKIKLGDKGHPDICNVFSYYEVFNKNELSAKAQAGLSAQIEISEIEENCLSGKLGCVDCKNNLAEKLITFLSPYQEKRRELCTNIDKIWDILHKGSSYARKIAKRNLEEVKKVVRLNYDIQNKT
jgi:tryptophanyl-tRNA synthetase